MTNQHNDSTQPDADRSEKRPYIKPAFRYETVFEVMALACGKTSGVQASCRTNRKNS